MKLNKSYLFGLLLVAAQLTFGLSLSETSPAFLWSSHYFRPSTSGGKEAVNYCAIASHELASLVLTEGGWSKVVCSREDREPTADVALLFVGRTLQSSDISRDNHADPALVDILKHSFTASNSSMAFPYVVKSDVTESLENSLLSDILKACGDGAEEGRTIAISESCSVHGDGFVKLGDLQSVQDHLTSKVGPMAKGQAHLVLYCSDGSLKTEHAQAEGEELVALTDAMEKLGTTYTVLYASDPHKSHLYVTDRALERFLAEGSRDVLLNSTNCDGVCQIKSSLLEGIFVQYTAAGVKSSVSAKHRQLCLISMYIGEVAEFWYCAWLLRQSLNRSGGIAMYNRLRLRPPSKLEVLTKFRPTSPKFTTMVLA